MHNKMVVANWKMNFNIPESLAHFDKVAQSAENHQGVDVVICPTFLSLFALWVRNKGRVKLGAQDCNAKDAGALTGEVAAAMLEGVAEYVIVGHSERRKFFHETDAEINRKVIACLKHGLKPIICIGETLSDKKESRTDQVIRGQLDGALLKVQPDVVKNTTIAYEPVWAIGSGQTPTAADLAGVIETIHSQFDFMYGGDFQPQILYGGSVDENNVENFLAIDGVGGFLVGGASLNMKKFDTIIQKVKGNGE
jgi:triosephosphate isomerase